jgi:7-cyano-7-deazaguanine synthase
MARPIRKRGTSILNSTLNPALPVAVLFSGGLDSAILAATLAKQHPQVQPIYIRTDVVWAYEEELACNAFLDAIQSQTLRPVLRLTMPLGDLYLGHWSITGQAIPDAASPDEAVFLPGRNALLLIKAVVWCQKNAVAQLALAPLASNPFDDAQPVFFQRFEEAMAAGYGARVALTRPFAHLHKREVMRLGRELPLELTFSCISPRGGLHCGKCNKCHERKEAFRLADIPDRTQYA